jgi:SAM-dependent methyltransferase
VKDSDGSKSLTARTLADIENYYTLKLSHFGETPYGVDWNSEFGQKLRFEQLLKLCNPSTREFSLNDLGCGYGALLDYLRSRQIKVRYTGIDISAEMISAARRRNTSVDRARFIRSSKPDSPADYAVASGIFNVRLARSDEEWFKHIESTLDSLNQMCHLGFSFNCLSIYSDIRLQQKYLFYADPCLLFDLCKRRYSRSVTLLHDYDLYEFTILVRKA